jgi:hypothetical protein
LSGDRQAWALTRPNPGAAPFPEERGSPDHQGCRLARSTSALFLHSVQELGFATDPAKSCPPHRYLTTDIALRAHKGAPRPASDNPHAKRSLRRTSRIRLSCWKDPAFRFRQIQAHNLKVVGSNPTPATRSSFHINVLRPAERGASACPKSVSGWCPNLGRFPTLLWQRRFGRSGCIPAQATSGTWFSRGRPRSRCTPLRPPRLLPAPMSQRHCGLGTGPR